MSSPTDRMVRPESGANMLRRAVRVLNQCRESALDPFTAEELLRILRACWASDWDVWPDTLTHDERVYAARHGKLSKRCLARLEREL